MFDFLINFSFGIGDDFVGFNFGIVFGFFDDLLCMFFGLSNEICRFFFGFMQCIGGMFGSKFLFMFVVFCCSQVIGDLCLMVCYCFLEWGLDKFYCDLDEEFKLNCLVNQCCVDIYVNFLVIRVLGVWIIILVELGMDL